MQTCTASTVWYAWGHINSFCSHLWFPVSLCLPHKSWPEAAASSFPCENWLALPKRPWLYSTTIPSSPARCPRGLVLHHPHCLAHFNSSLWAYLLSHTLEIDTQLFYMLLDENLCAGLKVSALHIIGIKCPKIWTCTWPVAVQSNHASVSHLMSASIDWETFAKVICI